MRAGTLRHQGSIQKLSTSNTYGEITKTWNNFKSSIWCSIEPLKGKEYFDSDVLKSEVDTRIKLRYLPGVKPQMRFVYSNRVFKIQSVIDIENRHKELHLMCKEDVE